VTAFVTEIEELESKYRADHQANEQQENAVNAVENQAANEIVDQSEDGQNHHDESDYADFKHREPNLSINLMAFIEYRKNPVQRRTELSATPRRGQRKCRFLVAQAAPRNDRSV
jgi:hypothetical protein